MSKQFKIVERTPEILKLKIAFQSFEFKKVEKITLNGLSKIITEINNKLKDQSQKNTILEDIIKQLRKDFDLITT